MSLKKTLRGVARETGLSAMYISELERCAKTTLSPDTLLLLGNAYKIESPRILKWMLAQRAEKAEAGLFLAKENALDFYRKGQHGRA